MNALEKLHEEAHLEVAAATMDNIVVLEELLGR